MANKLGYRDGGKTSEEGINRITSRLTDNAGVLGSDSLNVAEAGSPNNTVEVAVGDIVIGENSPNNAAADYYYHGWVTSVDAQTITSNSSGNPRVDVVVAYVDLTVVSTASSDNPGALEFAVVAGTPAANPSAPADSAIQTAVGASNPWIALAQVDVANGFSTITDADITDLRPKALTVKYLTSKGGDFVAEGLLWSQDSGLIGQMTSGLANIGGKLISKGYLKKTFTASKDTYVDIPNTAKPTSTDDLTYTEVSNGAAAPALAAGSIRVAKIVTDGSGITSSVTSGGDSLSNPVRPTSTIPNGGVSSAQAALQTIFNQGLNSTPNSTSFVDITNSDETFTVDVDSYAIITFFGDLRRDSNGSTTLGLNIDGSTDYESTKLKNTGVEANAATISKTVRVSLTAGEHTIKLRAKGSTTSNSSVNNNGWTAIIVAQ